MTKEECIQRIIQQKNLSPYELARENRSLRIKNRIAYAGLIALTAFSLLAGRHAVKTATDLDKAQQENKGLRENVTFYQKNTLLLSKRVMNLSDYAIDAEKLANSMQFYPSEPDGIPALPEKDQAKAEKEFLDFNIKQQKEHDKALRTLGVDPSLLFRIQKGPELSE